MRPLAGPPGLADRTLLELIDVAIHPEGYAHVVFTASRAPSGGLRSDNCVWNQVTGPGVGVGAHS